MYLAIIYRQQNHTDANQCLNASTKQFVKDQGLNLKFLVLSSREHALLSTLATLEDEKKDLFGAKI